MKTIILRVFTLLACIWLANSTGSGWWSLAVSQCAQKVLGNTCEDCEALNGSLAEGQLQMCKSDKAPMQGIARGARSAALACQTNFHNRKWNCSTFEGNHLFGEFIYESSTRESAVLQVYNSAGATQGLADFCHSQRIQACPCVHPSFVRIDEDGNRILTTCNDNVDWAAGYLQDFQNQANDLQSELETAIQKHNLMIGINAMDNTGKECTCHGISGSCTIQTCYVKAPEVMDISNDLFAKYDNAVQVQLIDNELRLANNPGKNVSDDNLVYAVDSPSFCNADLDRGVIGVQDRVCNPDLGSGTVSCASLCCDRGFYTRTYTRPISECAFVFEPVYDILCKVVRNETVLEHKCNRLSSEQ